MERSKLDAALVRIFRRESLWTTEIRTLLEAGLHPDRSVLVDGQEDVLQTEVVAFFEHLGKASWYRQLVKLDAERAAYSNVFRQFKGRLSEVTDSADLKESLCYLHLVTSTKAGEAIRPGIDAEDITGRAPGIHKALTRIGQLASAG